MHLDHSSLRLAVLAAFARWSACLLHASASCGRLGLGSRRLRRSRGHYACNVNTGGKAASEIDLMALKSDLDWGKSWVDFC